MVHYNWAIALANYCYKEAYNNASENWRKQQIWYANQYMAMAMGVN